MNRYTTRIVDAMNALFGGAIEARYKEGVALAGTDQADAGKFRRISSGSVRDLNPIQYKDAAAKSFFLWQRNGLAQRLIQIIVDFISYDMEIEVKIMTRKEDGTREDTGKLDAQDAWEKFCDDPVNNFEGELPTLIQDRLLFGELCLPVAVNQFDGSVRFGYLDTSHITRVVHDASGKQAETVYFCPEGTSDEKPLKVIRYQFDMPESADGAPAIDAMKPMDGECFFFRSNRVMNQTRGHGELVSSLDWIDGLDQFMFNSLENGALRNAFFYWLQLKGKTEKELKEVAKTLTTPPPGSIRVTNENATYNVVSPELKATDSSEFARMFKNFILATKGYPEHWFADGGNTNLATAENMGVPVMKMLKRHQNDLKTMIKMIAMYVVTRSKLVSLADGEYIEIEVSMFDFERKDAAVISAAFRDIIGSLGVAVNSNWVDDEKAKTVVDGLLQRLGVEPTEGETVEQIRAKNEKNRANDVYANNPPSGAFGNNAQPANGNQPRNQNNFTKQP